MKSLLFVFACCLCSVAYGQYALDHPIPKGKPSIVGGILCGVVNEKAIVQWTDTTTGEELYATDLAQPSLPPVLLADIAPGPGSSRLEFFTPDSGALWFCQRWISGTTFWKTDGTPGGTINVFTSIAEMDTFIISGNNIYILDIYQNLFRYHIPTNNSVQIDSNVTMMNKFKNGIVYVSPSDTLKVNDGLSLSNITIGIIYENKKIFCTPNKILISTTSNYYDKIYISNGTSGNLSSVYSYYRALLQRPRGRNRGYRDLGDSFVG